MSIQLRYDRGKHILFATIENEINEEMFEAALTKIVTSKEYPPDVNILWDTRQLPVQPIIDSGLVKSFIEIREKFPQRGQARTAQVVSTDLAFGITRMHQILSDHLPQNVRVFKDFEAAEQWLLEDRGVNWS